MEKDLIIPIYIDTNSLLDVVSTIEGGFNFVEKITSSNLNLKSSEKDFTSGGGTEFGIPNVLSLLKLNLNFQNKKQNTDGTNISSIAEKIHTYGSIFHRLREYLRENNLLNYLENIEDWKKIEVSDFIEVQGIFRPNPMADAFEQILSLINLMQFSFKLTVNSSDAVKKNADKKQISESNDMKKFVEDILGALRKDEFIPFIIEINDSSFKVVTFLSFNYFRDKSLKEINFKEYKLLGKVIRKHVDSQSGVSLVQGTGLNSLKSDLVGPLFEAFSQTPGINLPKIETEVTGNVLEILPIAIFI